MAYRKRVNQCSMMEPWYSLSAEKKARLEGSWADVFRTKALPLIKEDLFAGMYSDTGRPNVPVQTLIGFLLLKEMNDLTYREALEQLEFNMQWHHALQLTADEAHFPQKTVHNFLARLQVHDGAGIAFRSITQQIIEILGIKTARQRVDSTHIMSNFATLTRLGLFCETSRVFLRALRKEHPRLFDRVPAGTRRRYLKDDGDAVNYEDARSSDGPRRIAVCGRDIYRLLALFKGTAAEKMEEYQLLERLFAEQCALAEDDSRPGDDDDDAGEGSVPMRLKEPGEIRSDTLQTPHDPDVTYSGHKGKGYEAQICETTHEDNDVEIITEVRITDSCGSDANETIPTIEVLKERGLQPEELLGDTTYGGAKNAVAAARLGTELISPVAGTADPETPPTDQGAVRFSGVDFSIDLTGTSPATCPAGHAAIRQEPHPQTDRKLRLTFARGACDECPMFPLCCPRPNVKEENYTVDVNLEEANREARRRAEADGTFQKRYAARAGIEATNSELKRAHGLGRLRVRGRRRVELFALLKAAACNMKRFVITVMARAEAAEAASEVPEGA